MNDWFQRCPQCDGVTAPCDRERHVCPSCGGDTRTTNERIADAVWFAACVVAVPLAMPAIAVTLLGIAAYDALGGKRS